MISLTSTPISSRLHQVRVGGDVAVLKGLMKVLVEEDERARAEDQIEIMDWDFIRGHTVGIEALIANLKATRWEDIESRSGLTRAAIEGAAHVYMKAERAIVVYGMGLPQHRHGAHNIQQLANLCLLKGNIGKDGAGLCPVRGHSNVQGDRTIGITEVPSEEFLDRLEKRFGFKPPAAHGHNVVTAAGLSSEDRATTGGAVPFQHDEC
jgi:anaerobic selenocysteine-containing dehydrogenase